MAKLDIDNLLRINCETEQDSDDDNVASEETPVIGFWSGFVWLAGMTLIIALLSEYVVGTIEVYN